MQSNDIFYRAYLFISAIAPLAVAVYLIATGLSTTEAVETAALLNASIVAGKGLLSGGGS